MSTRTMSLLELFLLKGLAWHTNAQWAIQDRVVIYNTNVFKPYNEQRIKFGPCVVTRKSQAFVYLTVGFFSNDPTLD